MECMERPGAVASSKHLLNSFLAKSLKAAARPAVDPLLSMIDGSGLISKS